MVRDWSLKLLLKLYRPKHVHPIKFGEENHINERGAEAPRTYQSYRSPNLTTYLKKYAIGVKAYDRIIRTATYAIDITVLIIEVCIYLSSSVVLSLSEQNPSQRLGRSGYEIEKKKKACRYCDTYYDDYAREYHQE